MARTLVEKITNCLVIVADIRVERALRLHIMSSPVTGKVTKSMIDELVLEAIDLRSIALDFENEEITLKLSGFPKDFQASPSSRMRAIETVQENFQLGINEARAKKERSRK